jgi:hypothetical protein
MPRSLSQAGRRANASSPHARASGLTTPSTPRTVSSARSRCRYRSKARPSALHGGDRRAAARWIPQPRFSRELAGGGNARA